VLLLGLLFWGKQGGFGFANSKKEVLEVEVDGELYRKGGEFGGLCIVKKILGSLSGPRPRASRLILPTTVCRSSSAVPDNTNRTNYIFNLNYSTVCVNAFMVCVRWRLYRSASIVLKHTQ